MMLPDGYSDVPAGKIAAIVTSLEMAAPAPARPEAPDPRWRLYRNERPAPDWYRDLYRRVGESWLWFSRLNLGDAALAAILDDSAVEIYALTVDDRPEGLLELDYREPGMCELAFFGVTPALIGADDPIDEVEEPLGATDDPPAAADRVISGTTKLPAAKPTPSATTPTRAA